MVIQLDKNRYLIKVINQISEWFHFLGEETMNEVIDLMEKNSNLSSLFQSFIFENNSKENINILFVGDIINIPPYSYNTVSYMNWWKIMEDKYLIEKEKRD